MDVTEGKATDNHGGSGAGTRGAAAGAAAGAGADGEHCHSTFSVGGALRGAPPAPGAQCPPPTTVKLSVRGEANLIGPSPIDNFMALVRVRAPALSAEATRAPIRISCVCDVSGSMSGDKMRLMRNSLKFMLEHLRATDQLSVVSFSDAAHCVVPMASTDDEGQFDAKIKIDAMTPGGCTNLSAGLLLGFEQLSQGGGGGPLGEATYIASASNMGGAAPAAPAPNQDPCDFLFLCTDGHANRGVTDDDGWARLAADAKTRYPGTTIAAFGFGADHSSELLRRLADMYYFVETAESIPASFGDALGGMLSVVAQNVRLSIVSASPWSRLVNVVTPFPTHLQVDGIEVEIGDLFAEETRDILVELELLACGDSGVGDMVESSSVLNPEEENVGDGGDGGGDGGDGGDEGPPRRLKLPVLHCAMKGYDVILAEPLCDQPVILSVLRSAAPLSAPEIAAIDRDRGAEGSAASVLDEQINRVAAANAMEEAVSCMAQECGGESHGQAKRTLVLAVERINSSVSGHRPFGQSLVTDLRECIVRIESEAAAAASAASRGGGGSLSSSASHMMRGYSMSHSRQQSCTLSPCSPYSSSVSRSMSMTMTTSLTGVKEEDPGDEDFDFDAAFRSGSGSGTVRGKDTMSLAAWAREEMAHTPPPRTPKRQKSKLGAARGEHLDEARALGEGRSGIGGSGGSEVKGRLARGVKPPPPRGPPPAGGGGGSEVKGRLAPGAKPPPPRGPPPAGSSMTAIVGGEIAGGSGGSGGGGEGEGGARWSSRYSGAAVAVAAFSAIAAAAAASSASPY